MSLGFAVVALTLAATAFQPASANYAPCVENPEGPSCPGDLTSIHPRSSVTPAPAGHAYRHAYRGSAYGYRHAGAMRSPAY